MRSRLAAMEKWPMVYDLIHSLALHLSNASRSSSQGLHQSRTREEDTHVCFALYDIIVAFWHALLPEDEPIAMYPPRGEEEAGCTERDEHRVSAMNT